MDIPRQNEVDHPTKSKRAAAANSKTEKMRKKIEKLRKNFKLLDETKPKGKTRKKCKRKKKRGKKTKSCGRKRKKSRGEKRPKKKTRYYLENGKYKRNKKFDSWADEVTKMWNKVNILQDKGMVLIFLVWQITRARPKYPCK